mmetsp:Transcript_132806/g.283748  ORF Transcript_132806/g.283748 Transcript_132806/m.283748 type:complete len:153 (+) Transcript_132806:754-1212(+)
MLVLPPLLEGRLRGDDRCCPLVSDAGTGGDEALPACTRGEATSVEFRGLLEVTCCGPCGELGRATRKTPPRRQGGDASRDACRTCFSAGVEQNCSCRWSCRGERYAEGCRDRGAEPSGAGEEGRHDDWGDSLPAGAGLVASPMCKGGGFIDR